MEANELNIIGVLNLRNAIVEKAAEDYLKYFNVNGERQSLEIITIERWFRSNKFEILATGYSGEWFIKKLREMAREGTTKLRGKENNECRVVRLSD